MPGWELATNDATLHLFTKVGAENGLSTCFYSANNRTWAQFLNTNSTEHTQSLIRLQQGNYDYYFQCVDKAGNIAHTQTQFHVLKDVTTPGVIYTYVQDTQLFVILNEESTCKWDNEAFSFEQGYPTTGDGTTVHSFEIQGLENWVKCRDATGADLDVVKLFV